MNVYKRFPNLEQLHYTENQRDCRLGMGKDTDIFSKMKTAKINKHHTLTSLDVIVDRI